MISLMLAVATAAVMLAFASQKGDSLVPGPGPE